MPDFPSLTKTFHHDTYPGIDPRQRPELSLTDKVVVITGAGSGIGVGFTRAFAHAGAARIALLGRRKDKLEETQKLIEGESPSTKITIHATDVTDSASVRKTAAEIGSWDVLVSNAGYMSKNAPVVEADPEEWWTSFEINVKGSFNVAQGFLPTRSANATFISINAGSIQVPFLAPKLSAYNASKFALLKLTETLAAENEDSRFVSLHPGVVESDMTAASGIPHTDSPLLAGHFAVWTCSEEAEFVRGRFLWCNWDADELKARKDDFMANPLLTTANCIGWPYTY